MRKIFIISLLSISFLNLNAHEGHEKGNEFLLDAHRYSGYFTLLSSSLTSLLGWMTLNEYQKGKIPSDKLRKTHKFFGYTTITLSLTTSSLGFINFWKLREEKVGKRKRIIHMLLSSIATAGFITAGIIAYNARTLPDFDLYYTHRTAALLTTGGVVATILWIIW